MKKILVKLKNQSYSIQFGSYLKQFPVALKSLNLRPTKVLLVTSRGVDQARYPGRLLKVLKRKGFACEKVVIPNGEKYKNSQTLNALYRAAFKFGLDRRSLIIAMGGGVVTDMAGFLAASYMRGIPYVSIPTSILGMVDASIGGKTGIDTREGKNLIGAFWQPRLVWIDEKILNTLPDREWKTGFAEIIKYGVIKDARLFRLLEQKVRKNRKVKSWTNSELRTIIFRCAQIKANVVSRDVHEKPLAGGREILNFGHTTGHALEAATVYGKLTHGEAISVGMIIAGGLGLMANQWSLDAQLRLLFLIQLLGLPTRSPKLTQQQKKIFWSALLKDKKNISGSYRFVLPKKIGQVWVTSSVTKATLNRVMKTVGF